MPRLPMPRVPCALALTAAVVLSAAPHASAQLRPLEPFEWRMFDAGRRLTVQAGGAAYAGQRAALAGTEGTLLEAGSFRLFWRTDRVVFEAAGTVQLFFFEEGVFAAPEPYVRPAPDGRRRDSGDYLVISTVRLTPSTAPFLGILRFGTRLPTTDNVEGLGRDMTDFFALAGASVGRGALRLGLETGASINGTRDPDFEQRDVMPYLLRAEYGARLLVPGLIVTGDVLGPRLRQPGNEPLGEVRLGVRSSGRRWVRAEAVRGYRGFSPEWGIRVMAGGDW